MATRLYYCISKKMMYGRKYEREGAREGVHRVLQYGREGPREGVREEVRGGVQDSVASVLSNALPTGTFFTWNWRQIEDPTH